MLMSHIGWQKYARWRHCAAADGLRSRLGREFPWQCESTGVYWPAHGAKTRPLTLCCAVLLAARGSGMHRMAAPQLGRSLGREQPQQGLRT